MDVSLCEHDVLSPPSQLAPWGWQLIDCDASFVDVRKHVPVARICMYFLELQHKYCCPESYTDASKADVGVSYAVINPSLSDAGVLHQYF